MAGESDEFILVGVFVGCNCSLLDSTNELAFCEEAFQNAIDVVFKFLNLIKPL
jgi:hypothetical protein